MNITEDYVSFETAKLLKEKGFDVDTEHEMWYVVEKFSTGCHWNSCTYKVGDITREYDEKCCIAMPTLQMAMKWLREVHQIFIRPNTSFLYPIKWYSEIFCYGDNLKTQQDVKTECYDSPEESCEAAIKYCLENLI